MLSNKLPRFTGFHRGAPALPLYITLPRVVTTDSTVTNLQPAFGDMSHNGIPAADVAFLTYGP